MPSTGSDHVKNEHITSPIGCISYLNKTGKDHIIPCVSERK